MAANLKWGLFLMTFEQVSFVLHSHDITVLSLSLSLFLSLLLVVDHIMTPSLKRYMGTAFLRGSPELVLQREIISNLHRRVVPCKTHIMCSHCTCLCPVGLTH